MGSDPSPLNLCLYPKSLKEDVWFGWKQVMGQNMYIKTYYLATTTLDRTPELLAHHVQT